MKKMMIAALATAAALNLSACAEMTNQDVGTMTGAVAGGVLGSTVGGGSGKLLAIGAGTLVGAYMGGAIGQHMDRQDHVQMTRALEHNNVGQPAYWHNNKTGASYHVTPVRNVTVKHNRYCREYRTTADINGKQQKMYGTACRQPDGSWKVVK